MTTLRSIDVELRKLAFVGTSCTGKTTLTEAFRDDPRVAIVPEAARAYFSTNTVDTAVRFSAPVQGAIQQLVIANERAAVQLGKPILLCDRSVLDAVVYTKFWGDKAGANEMYARAIPFIPTYERLVVLDPTDVPYRRDDIRLEDEGTRQAIHEEFCRFLNKKRIPFNFMAGSREERANQVRSWIDGTSR